MTQHTHWAIDLGTTNTVIARWLGTHAETVHLEDITNLKPAWQTPLVPSLIYFNDAASGYIGTKALVADDAMRNTYAGNLTPFARTFKKVLARNSQQPVAEVNYAPISARQCATVYMKELLDQVNVRERSLTSRSIPKWNLPRKFVAWARREGLVNDLTMTVPVDCFEPYRMELANIARKLGVQRFKWIDEPVAAALGYGLDLTEDRNLLIVDFGGGTLDIAVVRTNLGQSESGVIRRSPTSRKAEVLGARGLSLGGDTVDEWLTDMVCKKLGAQAERMRPYIRQQAEAVKLELSGKVLTTDETFFRVPGLDPIHVSRAEFLEVLKERELYSLMEKVTEAALEDAEHRLQSVDLDAVLLVGGSTLLPGVRDLYEKLFGANRVFYWEPFEAVVKGAAIYGAGYYVDQIVHHDYAIRVYSENDQHTEYEMLVRRGTPYPTKDAFKTRYYAVASRQTHFSLPVCEVGYAGRLSLEWKRRSNGNTYWTPTEQEEQECVVLINEGNVTKLSKAGQGNQARLRIDFSVDEQRYLCATIYDMLTEKDIQTAERVTVLR